MGRNGNAPRSLAKVNERGVRDRRLQHEPHYRATTPRLEFRSGLWVPVWLCGLAVISWLGEYLAPADGVGNVGLLGFGWAIVVLAVFSALIPWMATALCLPMAASSVRRSAWG